MESEPQAGAKRPRRPLLPPLSANKLAPELLFRGDIGGQQKPPFVFSLQLGAERQRLSVESLPDGIMKRVLKRESQTSAGARYKQEGTLCVWEGSLNGNVPSPRWPNGFG